MTQTVPASARQARAERGIVDAGGERAFTLQHTGPENVAPLVVYLATDAARNVNGQIFFVMGGLIALLNDPAPARTIPKDDALDARGDRDASSRARSAWIS